MRFGGLISHVFVNLTKGLGLESEIQTESVRTVTNPSEKALQHWCQDACSSDIRSRSTAAAPGLLIGVRMRFS